VSENTLLATVAALLDRGQVVDGLSRILTAAALVGLLLAPLATRPSWVLVACAMLVALAGLAESYLAMRVGFDAALFRQVAREAQPGDFTTTDAALTSLGLLPGIKLGRPAGARIAGARRLLQLQISAFGIQATLAFISGGLAMVRP
jgi:hypothetical protein